MVRIGGIGRPAVGGRANIGGLFGAVSLALILLALPAHAQQEGQSSVRVETRPPLHGTVEPERAPVRALADLAPGAPLRLTAFQVALRTEEPLAIRLVRLVTRTDGDLHRLVGLLESVAGDTIVVTAGLVPRPLRLPLAEIELVEARGGRYTWAGAKRGAEIGAFSGGLLFALLYRNGWAALLGSVVGAAPGAALGAAVGASDWEPVRPGD
jgi:hypothetical protein